jgi:hypothetical protein
MFLALKCPVSIWFFFLMNKYSFESKLFHFLSGTICTWIFVQYNRFTPLVYHCVISETPIRILMHSWVKIISKNIVDCRINTILVYWFDSAQNGWKNSLKLVLLPVSQPRQINSIFTIIRPILYIYLHCGKYHVCVIKQKKNKGLHSH